MSMGMRLLLTLFAGMFLVLGSLNGCAKNKEKWKSSAGVASAESAAESISRDSAEAALRKEVERYIASERRDKNDTSDRVVRQNPYLFKEYRHFPPQEPPYTISIVEQSTKSMPFRAEVSIPEIRYRTQFHRRRVDAEEDTRFFRSTGTERITYEFRNGKWVRLGSVFAASSTEEKVGNEWVPLREETKLASPKAEEHEGWWSRTWHKITGR